MDNYDTHVKYFMWTTVPVVGNTYTAVLIELVCLFLFGYILRISNILFYYNRVSPNLFNYIMKSKEIYFYYK